MRSSAVWAALPAILLLSSAPSKGATEDPYRITAKEKAACTTDAIRLCAHTYPNEGELVQCMKTNRSSLSSPCLSAFDAGMKRRHLE